MPTAPAARTSRPSARQQAANPASQTADPSKLSVSRAAPAVNPKVETAWRAYNQGDLQAARTNYLETLREEPSNRDALLGMAAIEVRANRPELAEPYYRTYFPMIEPARQAAKTALGIDGVFFSDIANRKAFALPRVECSSSLVAM